MKNHNPLNNKGTVLQIVLIIFLVMTFSLTLCLSFLKGNMNNYHYVDVMMKQKNLEIMLVSYYIKQLENDILLSDSYELSGYEISSQVDDLGTFYEITTHIESKDMNYQFLIQVSTKDHMVLKFEYREV